MTPEDELQALIEEQRRDDTDHIWPERFVQCSLDAPIPGLDRVTFADAIGVDLDGEIVSFLPTGRGFAMGRHIPHGTEWGYVGHACRCRRCTDANTTAHVARQARREAADPVVRENRLEAQRRYDRKRWADNPEYREAKNRRKREARAARRRAVTA